MCDPPHGGACCVGAWPSSWWGVLCCFLAPLMVGRAVLVRGPPPWRGALWWCMAPLMVGRAVVVLGPPHGGACCVGAWPPSWWCVLWWCLAPFMLERTVLVCGPPHVGGCLVGAGVCVCGRRFCFGCGSVGAWPGRAGQPPERVRCASPLSWPVQTGWPPERVRCATLCCCFPGVIALPLVFPCSPSAFWFLRGCWLAAGGRRRPLLPRPLPRGVVRRRCRRCAAVLPTSSPCLLVAAVGRPRIVAAAGRARRPCLLVLAFWLFPLCHSFSRAGSLLCPCCAPFRRPPTIPASCCPPPPPPPPRGLRCAGVAALLPVFLCVLSAC